MQPLAIILGVAAFLSLLGGILGPVLVQSGVGFFMMLAGLVLFGVFFALTAVVVFTSGEVDI